jgi:hypothetical protein
MIRINKWGGWLSYVSPYFIPNGGMMEQVNMVCLLPGQIDCRGGMENLIFKKTEDPNSGDPVEGDPLAGIPLELWGYTKGPTTDKIFAFTSEGEIEIKSVPSI